MTLRRLAALLCLVALIAGCTPLHHDVRIEDSPEKARRRTERTPSTDELQPIRD